MQKLISKTTGKLLIGVGSVGFPASFCLMFAVPMGTVLLIALLEGNPSDHPGIGAVVYAGNVLASLFGTFCMLVSPVLAMIGLVVYILADQQAKKAQRPNPGPLR